MRLLAGKAVLVVHSQKFANILAGRAGSVLQHGECGLGDILQIWPFGEADAKERVATHLKQGHHYAQGCAGINIDFSSGIWPPRMTAPQMNAWFLESFLGRQRIRRLGFFVIDFATPDICQFVMQQNFNTARSAALLDRLAANPSQLRGSEFGTDPCRYWRILCESGQLAASAPSATDRDAYRFTLLCPQRASPSLSLRGWE